MARLKIAVLISGRGSNLQALIEACAAPDFPARIVLVISNKPEAQGLERAAKADIPTQIIPHGGFKTRGEFDAALDQALKTSGAGLVCLAGFMRVLGADFVKAWRDRLVNIHPSLLPEFPGLDTHARALAGGAKRHGCTVHFVRAEVDSGPAIVQAAVPVMPGDDPNSLALRVLGAEHKAYPLALRLIAEGRARLRGDRVEIDGRPGPLRIGPAA